MFDYQNIIAGNGVNISLTGMFIVFSGLMLLSLYIYFLPKALSFFEKTPSDEAENFSPAAEILAAKDEADDKAEADELEAHDIASIIGIVLHMEMEKSRLIDDQRITIIRDEYRGTLWGMPRKLRVAPFRRS